MKLFRFESSRGPHVGIDIEGSRFDLTSTSSAFHDIAAWLAVADPIRSVLDSVEACRSFPIDPAATILPPLDHQEVWASGVTYLRSKVARMDESRQSAYIYDRVYEAERPELFFKAVPSRVSGHLMPIRIRRDSTWNVPEPELVLVISSRGEVVGTTIGNDMSSRSIEGDNPLYLPQAKIYEGSCALGPAIDLTPDPANGRAIQLNIERDGAVVFNGEISTSRMRRTPSELARWLFTELRFPAGVFLFTGTGIVPPNNFSLKERDIVKISIEGIGTLENQVAENG
jgi:2-dehydro-3-deoxy-D-arabinonate dehydratase